MALLWLYVVIQHVVSNHHGVRTTAVLSLVQKYPKNLNNYDFYVPHSEIRKPVIVAACPANNVVP
jgi:hypothetical protein